MLTVTHLRKAFIEARTPKDRAYYRTQLERAISEIAMSLASSSTAVREAKKARKVLDLS